MWGAGGSVVVGHVLFCFTPPQTFLLLSAPKRLGQGEVGGSRDVLGRVGERWGRGLNESL